MNGELMPEDREFIARAKAMLDRSVNEIDHSAELRLQRARLSALDSPRRRTWLLWASATTVSVVALAILIWLRQPAPAPTASVPLEDFELVTSVEDVELAEDLDFYHWLADDDAAG
jgi:hypothetical protein